jgi:hypothetical protein
MPSKTGDRLGETESARRALNLTFERPPMIRAAEHTVALSISAISELDLLISRIYLERGTSAHTSIC